MKKISIVMPMYNVEKYISASIQSVLQQTYENFELIIVDDGSQDSSSEIANGYAKDDSRIKVVHKANGGLSDARNFGLLHACGDYVIFIDSDDYWDNSLLQKAMDFSAKNDLDVTVFGYKSVFYDDKGSVIKTDEFTELTKVIDKSHKNASPTVIENKNLLGYAWNKLYKISIIKDNNLTFTVDVSYVEDILFNTQVYKYAGKIGFLDDALYYYAQRPRVTLGRKYYDNMSELDTLSVKSFEASLNELGVSDTEVSKFIAKSSYLKARWSIGIIANTDKIAKNKKITKVMEVLDSVNSSANDSHTASSAKDKIYRFMFKHRMAKTIIAVENVKAGNFKRLLLDQLPNQLKAHIQYIVSRSDVYGKLDRDTKKIIVALAADYGNLGDVAITYAQKKFLQDSFQGYDIVELPISRTYRDLKSLKRKISDKDIITTVGGGNMGDLYEDIEEQRRFIVSKFPHNKIFSFPQTIDFTGTGKSLKKSQRIYGGSRSLVLFAREKKSYECMKDLFTNKICLTPDIVLSLNESSDDVTRDKNKVTLCIRQDSESVLSSDHKQKLISLLESNGKNITYRDTHIGDVTLSAAKGEDELRGIWNEFRTSGLVITDRLHGMIFCAITKTPCIAINNSNGKVMGVWNSWLKNTNYVTVVDSSSLGDINKYMTNLSKLNYDDLSMPCLDDGFRRLKSAMLFEISK